jgi:acetyl esterase/lipase
MKGILYLRDFDKKLSYIFNAEGTLLKKFALEGEDHEIARYINCFTFGENVVIGAMDKLHFYTRDGELIRSVPNNIFMRFPLAFIDNSAYLVAPGALAGIPGGTAEITKVDLAGGKDSRFAEIKLNEEEKALPPGGVIVGLTPQILASCDEKNGRIYFCKNSDYSIFIADSDGNILKRFGRELERVPVSLEERKEHLRFFLKDAPDERITSIAKGLPGELAHFHNIQVNDGFLYVFRTTEFSTKLTRQVIDIFSLDGEFLYTGTIRFEDGLSLKNVNAVQIRGNSLYALLADENGESRIVKYKIDIPSARNVPRNSSLPAAVDTAVEMDVVYAVVDGQELKLDIAMPRNLAAPAPAIIDIQGGSWRHSQNTVEDAKLWAGYGFIGVSIAHRTSDVAVFPAAVHDCKAAVRWLRANAKKYNVDPDRIGITGFSSGGHLAALSGTSGGDAYLEGSVGISGYSSGVQAVVDHFGPTDFNQMNDGKQIACVIDHFAPNSPESLFLGGPLRERAEMARLANPLTYVDPGDPPMLITHGENDRLVPIEQSEILYEALKRADVPVEFIRVRNADHMYRPYPEGAKVSPSVDELNQASAAWFIRWLGPPKLKSPEQSPAPPAADMALKTNLYYKLTIDLPGCTAESYVKGTFWVKCGEQELVSGKINLADLSSEAGRTFNCEFTATGIDFSSCELTWNFSGEVYDSKLDGKLSLTNRQIAKYNDQVEGVGFHFQIAADGTPDVQKKVYMKNR